MSKQVLIETYTAEQANFVLDTANDGSGKKNWYLEGVCMQAEVKNRNNRTYPLKEIAGAVEQMQQSIRDKQCFGELDHPSDSRIAVNLKTVSHMCEKLYMKGNDAIGRLKIFETDMGMIAIKILEGGGRLGVSTRGTGDVLESGNVSGFNCSCIDLVSLPSAPNAMPASVYESLHIDMQGERVLTLVEAAKQDPIAQKYLQDEITKWVANVLLKR